MNVPCFLFLYTLLYQCPKTNIKQLISFTFSISQKASFAAAERLTKIYFRNHPNYLCQLSVNSISLLTRDCFHTSIPPEDLVSFLHRSFFFPYLPCIAIDLLYMFPFLSFSPSTGSAISQAPIVSHAVCAPRTQFDISVWCYTHYLGPLRMSGVYSTIIEMDLHICTSVRSQNILYFLLPASAVGSMT